MLNFLAPRLSPAYRDCKVPLLLVTMLGDFVQGQRRCMAAVSAYCVWNCICNSVALAPFMFELDAALCHSISCAYVD